MEEDHRLNPLTKQNSSFISYFTYHRNRKCTLHMCVVNFLVNLLDWWCMVGQKQHPPGSSSGGAAKLLVYKTRTCDL